MKKTLSTDLWTTHLHTYTCAQTHRNTYRCTDQHERKNSNRKTDTLLPPPHVKDMFQESLDIYL